MNGIFQHHEEMDDSITRQCKFVYQNMRGFEEEVCDDGNDLELKYDNLISQTMMALIYFYYSVIRTVSSMQMQSVHLD